MKLTQKKKLDNKYRCWDITTKRHHNFVANDVVVHNCNSRYVWIDDRIWCGSRTKWKKENDKNIWWKALRQNPWIQDWCRAHPGLVLYGEVFGQVQNLKYGAGPNDIFFRAFDILDHNVWLDYNESRTIGSGLKWVPLVYEGPFNEDKIRELAEQDSMIEGANHIREGVVISPIKERNDPQIGRVKLKIVSNKYLSKG